MSAAPAVDRPALDRPARVLRTTARTTPAQTTAPTLRLITPPRTSPARAPFVLLVVGILVVGLLGLLALNTLLAQGSFQLHTLQNHSTELAEREQLLQQQVAAAEEPTALALAAAKLGMVPGGAPLFLSSEDGTVLGDPGAKNSSAVASDAVAQLAAGTSPIVRQPAVTPATPATPATPVTPAADPNVTAAGTGATAGAALPPDQVPDDPEGTTP